eukprot:SAG31_NODE_1609_length_7753_cov_12.390253_8_plen_75_part_00
MLGTHHFGCGIIFCEIHLFFLSLFFKTELHVRKSLRFGNPASVQKYKMVREQVLQIVGVQTSILLTANGHGLRC